MRSNSYEMILWIPFDKQLPEAGHPIIVFSTTLGVVKAMLHFDGLDTGNVQGVFTHWAERIKGPSTAQRWVDRLVAWLPGLR